MCFGPMTPSGSPPRNLSVTEKSRSTVATPPTSLRLAGERTAARFIGAAAQPETTIVHVKMLCSKFKEEARAWLANRPPTKGAMYGTCGKVGPTGSVLPQLPSRPSGAQGTTLDKKDSVGVRTSAPCCTTCTTSMERARTPEKEMRSRKQGGTPEASAQRPPPHAACAASQARITLAGA